MFNRIELLQVVSSLMLQEKSLERLANKPGQTPGVKDAYRSSMEETKKVREKASAELARLEQAARVEKKP